MNQNLIKSYLSQMNSFLPSMLAIANIFFISKMYQTVTKQNAEIIELLSNVTSKVAEEVIQPVVNAAVANPEVSLWNTIAGYAIPIGSVVICAVLIYIYFTSGGPGSGPDLPPIDTKNLEEVLSEKIEEKSSEIITVIVDKTNDIVSERFITVGFNYIVSSISKAIKTNNAESSKVLLNQVKTAMDDSNTAAIDLIDSRVTDISTIIDANHAESTNQINGLRELISTFFANSGS